MIHCWLFVFTKQPQKQHNINRQLLNIQLEISVALVICWTTRGRRLVGLWILGCPPESHPLGVLVVLLNDQREEGGIASSCWLHCFAIVHSPVATFYTCRSWPATLYYTIEGKQKDLK